MSLSPFLNVRRSGDKVYPWEFPSQFHHSYGHLLSICAQCIYRRRSPTQTEAVESR